MSTGADCRFIGEAPNRWFLEHQKYPYGETSDYHRHGPFASFELAHKYLRDNYANPGGYSIDVKFVCSAHSWSAWKKQWANDDFESRTCSSCQAYEQRDTLTPKQKLEKQAARLREELAKVEAQIAKA